MDDIRKILIIDVLWFCFCRKDLTIFIRVFCDQSAFSGKISSLWIRITYSIYVNILIYKYLATLKEALATTVASSAATLTATTTSFNISIFLILINIHCPFYSISCTKSDCSILNSILWYFLFLSSSLSLIHILYIEIYTTT